MFTDAWALGHPLNPFWTLLRRWPGNQDLSYFWSLLWGLCVSSGPSARASGPSLCPLYTQDWAGLIRPRPYQRHCVPFWAWVPKSSPSL